MSGTVTNNPLLVTYQAIGCQLTVGLAGEVGRILKGTGPVARGIPPKLFQAQSNSIEESEKAPMEQQKNDRLKLVGFQRGWS